MQLRCPIRISIAAKLSSVDIVDDHAPSHALHRVEVSQCVLQFLDFVDACCSVLESVDACYMTFESLRF